MKHIRRADEIQHSPHIHEPLICIWNKITKSGQWSNHMEHSCVRKWYAVKRVYIHLYAQPVSHL